MFRKVELSSYWTSINIKPGVQSQKNGVVGGKSGVFPPSLHLHDPQRLRYAISVQGYVLCKKLNENIHFV